MLHAEYEELTSPKWVYFTSDEVEAARIRALDMSMDDRSASSFVEKDNGTIEIWDPLMPRHRKRYRKPKKGILSTERVIVVKEWNITIYAKFKDPAIKKWVRLNLNCIPLNVTTSPTFSDGRMFRIRIDQEDWLVKLSPQGWWIDIPYSVSSLMDELIQLGKN